MRAHGPQPQPGILDIHAYQGGGTKAAPGVVPIKLSANESPLGPSPKAVEAVRARAEDLAIYPDGAAAELRAALGAAHRLDPERIVCGNGSDDLLALLAQAYCGPDTEVLIGKHSFAVYEIVAKANGAQVIEAPDKNLRFDVDALLERVSERTAIVFLANPNNPTGSYLNAQEISRLHAGLPDSALLVLDGAYAEYMDTPEYDDGRALIERSDNVVMTRTFSKIYGLAALRLGWAYGPEPVVDVLNRVRGPFNVSLLAQAAGIAALEDTAHTQAAKAHNDRWRPWLEREIAALGYEVVPSAGNFLLVGFSSANGAKAADAFLKSQGLILRAMGGYGLPNHLRLSVGSEDACRRVVAALEAFKAQVPA